MASQEPGPSGLSSADLLADSFLADDFADFLDDAQQLSAEKREVDEWDQDSLLCQFIPSPTLHPKSGAGAANLTCELIKPPSAVHHKHQFDPFTSCVCAAQSEHEASFDGSSLWQTIISAEPGEFEQMSWRGVTESCDTIDEPPDELSIVAGHDDQVLERQAELTVKRADHRSDWTCQWANCTGCPEDDLSLSHLSDHLQCVVQESKDCKLNSCRGLHCTFDEEHLNTHLESCNFGNGQSVRCTWSGTCTRRFMDLNTYRRHLETHSQLDSSRFHCQWKGCKSSGFSSVEELHQHVLHSHFSGASPPAAAATSCQWQGCSFELPEVPGETAADRMAKIQQHVMTAHADWDLQLPERVLVCRWGKCHRFFNEKTKFAQHMCMHTGMKKFQCDLCDQQFTSASQRRAHMRAHQRFFKCEVCASQGIEKSYTSRFNLKEHMRNVHERLELVCTNCKRSYKSHKAWSLHTKQCGRGKVVKSNASEKKVHLLPQSDVDVTSPPKKSRILKCSHPSSVDCIFET